MREKKEETVLKKYEDTKVKVARKAIKPQTLQFFSKALFPNTYAIFFASLIFLLLGLVFAAE